MQSEGSSGAQQASSARRRRWVFAALGISIVLLAVGVGYYLLVGQPKSGGPAFATLVEMNGESNAVSKHFFARQGWQVDWENTGQYFSYTIHGDTEFGQVVTQNGPGNGSTFPVPTGNFFIEVVAQGPWSITVTQGE